MQYLQPKELSGVWDGKKKNCLVWSWNTQLPLSSTVVPSADKPQRNDFFKPKEILSIGHAVTVLAGYVKFIFKILDFYNVKSHPFVKLANLPTISKKIIFFRQTYVFIFIYLHSWYLVNILKILNLTSYFALPLIKAMLKPQSDCCLSVWENSSPLVAVDCFSKESPSPVFDWVLTAPEATF